MRKKIFLIAALLVLAAAPLARAQVLGSDSYEVRLEQAKELYNSGMYVSAEKALEALARDLPTSIRCSIRR